MYNKIKLVYSDGSYIEINKEMSFKIIETRINCCKETICSFNNINCDPQEELENRIKLIQEFFVLASNYNYIKTVVINRCENYEEIKQKLFEILDKLLDIFNNERGQTEIIKTVVEGFENMVKVAVFYLKENNINDERFDEFKNKTAILYSDFRTFFTNKDLSNTFNLTTYGLESCEFVKNICNSTYKTVNENEKEQKTTIEPIGQEFKNIDNAIKSFGTINQKTMSIEGIPTGAGGCCNIF